MCFKNGTCICTFNVLFLLPTLMIHTRLVSTCCLFSCSHYCWGRSQAVTHRSDMDSNSEEERTRLTTNPKRKYIVIGKDGHNGSLTVNNGPTHNYYFGSSAGQYNVHDCYGRTDCSVRSLRTDASSTDIASLYQERY